MRDIAKELSHLRSQNAGQQVQLELFRDAVEHMHHGLCMFDADGRIVLCNSRYADVLQLPPEKVRPGVTLRELIEAGFEAGFRPPGETPAELEARLWANLASSNTRSTITRGGRTYAVQPGRTAGGHWIATFEDVTARLEAEAAVRQSEAQLRAFADAMPDCAKIFDEAGTLIYINPKGLELLQAPDLESLLNTPGYQPVAPEYLAECLEVHRRVLAGESVVWTYEVVGMRGRRRHVEAHAVPFRLPDGAQAHLCISRDINERKEADDALRRSEERLRLVQEATGLADFEAGKDGVAHFSPSLLKQMGLPEDGPTELAFEDWIGLVHPDDRERLREVAGNLGQSDTARCEFRIVRPDTGEIRWIASNLKIEHDEAGNISRAIGAHLDITERRLAEEELRASEERLRLVQEATGLADFEADANGLTSCSDRYFEQLGLSAGDSALVSKGCIDFVHPDDRERIVRELIEADEQRLEWSNSEFRVIRADDGAVRWIACSTKMERDENGGLVRMIGGHLDITERKKSETALRLSEERLRLVQEATGLADFEAQPGVICQLSDRFIEQTGLPPETAMLTLEEWLAIVHPADRERFMRHIMSNIEVDDSVQFEFRIVRPDNGEVRWISSHSKLKRDASGKAVASIGGHLDITERKQAEEALRESEERFRLAAEATGLGVWDYDMAQDRREWSDRLREILGIGPEVEPSLEVAEACIHPADRAKFNRLLVEARDTDIGRFEGSFRIRRASDGAERWIALNGWRTYKTDSKLRRIIMTVRDVTEEKTAEERVRWTASHDTLTRLANRSLFQEKLETAIEKAGESGRAVGLLVLDMDHFKQINDSLGHDAGDMLLKMFAERLRGVVRPSDTVARLGGDEFAVVLPELDGELDLLKVARAIQQRLRDPFLHGGRILDCRASIGASIYPDLGHTPDELLKNADIALYAGKAAGRGVVTLFEPHMRDDVQRRNSMVQLARNAILDDRIVPYYQPKLDLAQRTLVGFEALLRWRNPSGRIASPAALEAAFEDMDVAAQISDRMIERVIADMRGWLDRGVDFKSVAVNASAAEFRRDNFAERLLEQLRRADIPTRCFQLEVTETVFLGRGAEYVHRALALLNMRGVRIALDDFGTGYASLRHLKQFPVDVIKIDQSFVRDMAIDPGDEAIIRAVINLGRSLGIKVVAEGIETEEQERRLLELECHFGQGFLFSRAVPASRVPSLVERWPLRPANVERPVARDLRLVANRD